MKMSASGRSCSACVSLSNSVHTITPGFPSLLQTVHISFHVRHDSQPGSIWVPRPWRCWHAIFFQLDLTNASPWDCIQITTSPILFPTVLPQVNNPSSSIIISRKHIVAPSPLQTAVLKVFRVLEHFLSTIYNLSQCAPYDISISSLQYILSTLRAATIAGVFRAYLYPSALKVGG